MYGGELVCKVPDQPIFVFGRALLLHLNFELFTSFSSCEIRGDGGQIALTDLRHLGGCSKALPVSIMFSDLGAIRTAAFMHPPQLTLLPARLYFVIVTPPVSADHARTTRHFFPENA